MFNVTMLRATLLSATILFAATGYTASLRLDVQTLAPLQLLTLTAGTQVSVMLNESIDVQSVAIGNSLDFTVRSNVVVNGKVVISAGSPATGWVKNIRKSCGGKCTEITITVESAQAVDGQIVNLRSIPHTVNCTGASTTVNIGANLTANVLNDIRIDG